MKKDIKKDIRAMMLAFVMLFIIPTLTAQNKVTVTGVFADSLNQEKLSYVRVGLFVGDSAKQLKTNTFTNDKGSFSFKDIPAGQYELQAFLLGYEMKKVSLSIDGKSKTIDMGTMTMNKTETTLNEVNIVTEKPIYLIDGEKTMYNVSEDPTVQDGSAADALQNAPGVEVDVEGNITLRGVSSVDIWVNGKPSRMNEEGLKNFIRQLPANAIERIEVITNPSARYSAKSSGGIINVVTTGKIKKNSFFSFGINGSSVPEVNPYLSYAYGDEKLSVSVFLSGFYNLTKYKNEYRNIKLNDNFDTTSVTTGRDSSRNRNYGGNIYFDINYTFDTLNSIGWWVSLFPSFSHNSGMTHEQRHEFQQQEGLYEYGESNTQKNNQFGGWSGLWYEHVFPNDDRHTLGVYLPMNCYFTRGYSWYDRDYLLNDYLDKTRKKSSKNPSFNINPSIDYTVPYHKNGTVSAGVDIDYDNLGVSWQVDTIERTGGEYRIDSLRSVDISGYFCNVMSYVTIEHKFGNFTVKGGLQLDYNNRQLNFKDLPQYDFKQNLLNLYPSLHLSYRTESMHNFKLSYTRRVSHPSNLMNLSTYCLYDEDSYSTGNPDLKSTYTHSVEAGWTKFFQKFGSVGVNAYFKYNINERGTLTDVAYNDFFGRVVTFTQPVNIGRSYRTGADINVTYRLQSILNIRFYTNIYYYDSQFRFRDADEMQHVSNLGYSFRLNFWAKCWKVLDVSLSANYRSKSVTLFTENRPGYSIDGGFRADLLSRKLSVYLNVNDIFNWNKTTISDNNPYYVSNSKSQYNSRSISAGITLRFGKMELEAQASKGQNSSMM